MTTQERRTAGATEEQMHDARIQEIEARLAAASAGDWTACRMVHEERGDDLTPDELGEYIRNAVIKSADDSGSRGFLFISVETPQGARDVCHVGNGPTSPANADFIQHAKRDIEWLLARLKEPSR